MTKPDERDDIGKVESACTRPLVKSSATEPAGTTPHTTPYKYFRVDKRFTWVLVGNLTFNTIIVLVMHLTKESPAMVVD